MTHQEPEGRGRRRIRAMTWNIHACIGTDGRRDQGRIIRAIAAVRPDILALQEVDIRAINTESADLVEQIAGAAGDFCHEAYTMNEEDRRYGILLYSRWDIHRVKAHDLAWRRCEPRRVIDALVEVPGGPLRVISTHLGLSRRERRHQLKTLRDIVEEEKHPTIMLGDFNDWRRPGRIGRMMADRLPLQFAPRTFPSPFPLLALDRILLSRDLAGEILSNPIHATASDHRPVIVDVTLKDENKGFLPQ